MTGIYGTIVLRPSFWQWVVEKLPWIAVNIFGYLFAIDYDMPLLLCLMIAMTLHLLYMLLYLKMTKYTITNEEIIFEHGVLARQKEYIEMFRIIDFREDVSFLQNIFDLKTLNVYSGDRTMPELKIKGIFIGLQLVSTIRARVNLARKNRGIYEITNR